MLDVLCVRACACVCGLSLGDGDRWSLHVLFSKLNGDSWHARDGWSTPLPLKTFHGVTAIGNRVVQLLLPNSGIAGTYVRAIQMICK